MSDEKSSAVARLDALKVACTKGPMQPPRLEVVHQVHQTWLRLLMPHRLSFDGFDIFGCRGALGRGGKIPDMVQDVDFLVDSQSFTRSC
jgi:hypothetical protein